MAVWTYVRSKSAVATNLSSCVDWGKYDARDCEAALREAGTSIERQVAVRTGNPARICRSLEIEEYLDWLDLVSGETRRRIPISDL